MRIQEEKLGLKEVAFKEPNKKKRKHRSFDYSSYESDVEEAKFVRNLKSGIHKYRGKLPFNFFYYERIVHFSS